MFNVTLPDGSVRAYAGALTVGDVAASIGPGLAKAALAKLGITNPTPEQITAALKGGTVTTATGPVTMTGVHNCCKSCTNGITKAGSSVEGFKVGPSWQLHFERSRDNGVTWEKIPVEQAVGSPASIQPSIHQPRPSPTSAGPNNFQTGFHEPCLRNAGYAIRSAAISSGSANPTDAFADRKSVV